VNDVGFGGRPIGGFGKLGVDPFGIFDDFVRSRELAEVEGTEAGGGDGEATGWLEATVEGGGVGPEDGGTRKLVRPGTYSISSAFTNRLGDSEAELGRLDSIPQLRRRGF